MQTGKVQPSDKMHKSVDEPIPGTQATHHALFPNHGISHVMNGGSQYQDNTPSAQKRK